MPRLIFVGIINKCPGERKFRRTLSSMEKPVQNGKQKQKNKSQQSKNSPQIDHWKQNKTFLCWVAWINDLHSERLTLSYLTAFTSQLPWLFRGQHGASLFSGNVCWQKSVQERGKERIIPKKAVKQVGQNDQQHNINT